MRLLFLLTFCISTLNIFAQELSGKFDGGFYAGEYIYLFEREAKREIIMDSAKISVDGSFSFGDKRYGMGLYNLQWKTKHNKIEIIINPTESLIRFQIPNNNLKKYEVLSSNENRVYKAYKDQKRIRDKKLRKLSNAKKTAGMDATKTAEINNRINEIKKGFFESVSGFINENPDSFFTKLILASDADNKKAKHLYFSDLDFSDESFIRTNVLAKRYQEYIKLFSGGNLDGYLNCIDDILEKAKVNQKVYEFSAYNLLEGFHNTGGLTEVSNYIMDEYIFGDDCGGWEVSELLHARGNRIRSIQLDNIPPDLSLKNTGGKYSKLSEVTSKNKYTLLLFWASWCHKCENQMNEITKIYDLYNKDGFEIYAVSLDEHKASWNKAITEKGMNWINVCDFGSWQSENVRNYSVSKTPSFFLLDSDRKIIALPRNSNELTKVLNGLKNLGAL